MYGNSVRKRRRRLECQESTSKMCWHNMESESRTLTIMFHMRPSLIHVSVFVKLLSWCVTRQNKLFWSSMTFLWEHTKIYVNMWHENDDGSLETTSCHMYVLRSSHHYVWSISSNRKLLANVLLLLTSQRPSSPSPFDTGSYSVVSFGRLPGLERGDEGGWGPPGAVSIWSWSPLFFGCPLNLVLYMPFRIFTYSSNILKTNFDCWEDYYLIRGHVSHNKI